MTLSGRRRPLFVVRATLLSALLGLVGACANAPVGDTLVQGAPRPVAPRSATLVVGDVGSDPVDVLETVQPFADELAGRLAGVGIERAKVVVAASTEEMGALMSSGAVDVYIDSPYPAMVAAVASGGVPLLRRWKGGVEEYRSAVFVRDDSRIFSVRQLVGERVGMEEAISTTGYWLPSRAILASGLQLKEVDPDTPLQPRTVGYVFTGSDENTLFGVSRGRFAAGAMDENSLDELAGPDLAGVRVIYRSAFVPRHVVIRSRQLSPLLTAALETALVGLERDRAGRAALAAYDGTTRFDPLTPPQVKLLHDLVPETAPVRSR